MLIDEIKPDSVLRGPLFPEPLRIITVAPLGTGLRIVAEGLTTERVYQTTLTIDQAAKLEATPEIEPFDGDPKRFRLGVEALRLGFAYEYDPFFSLSIARVDPLPHQLQAVYDYFLRQPRIRFLLADDPGAGKTIMAGLLLKELKIRGLVKRTLIITPANLSFQWQREMRDKFRENFEVIRGDVLRSNYGSNPWQERHQVITSVSWVSRIEDAKDSLLRSEWDLIIVDEAHKMSAYSSDKKTLAYRLGEELSQRTDHYLLMTATPHKGDPVNFCLFLELLDRDVYGDVKSLEEAMRRNSAPFYLRRTKEALVTFPDPDTGVVRKLFTKRDVQTSAFQIDADELEFYDALTNYVEDESIKAQADDSPRGRALAFTMAMLQRRFASSLYAVRRSLERMRDKRQRILEDPKAYRESQIVRERPDDFDDLTEAEQQQIIENLEQVVASVDPAALREEIARLSCLIDKACTLESREIESKLTKLKAVITEHGLFQDPKTKLLIFTEHRDTLDYLVAKLRDWGLSVTQIHGAMKIGSRDEPGTRICAEREFREEAQVLVATEAAGEGINLQFCWMMVNYDIPWNPVRLEQRMGRIHRYGQVHDCLIFNFAAVNTREGRVLDKLLDRLRTIRVELGSDQVFDVVGEVFPANLLERLFREMYAKRVNLPDIEERIVRDMDPQRFREITESTLEGLAKRELNLSALIGKSVEAKERRLVPEIIEDFFTAAAPIAGMIPKETKRGSHVYRVGRVPRGLRPVGEGLEPKFGKLGREYGCIVFDKRVLANDPTAEWVTPGHPLFEAVRADLLARVAEDMERGTVFYDIDTITPYRLDVFTGKVQDGRGRCLHERLFVVQANTDGTLGIRQPTLFLDLVEAPTGTPVSDADGLPDGGSVEQVLVERALQPLLREVSAERGKEADTITRHIEISLNELIHRQNLRMADLEDQRLAGDNAPLLLANIKQVEDRLDELNGRKEQRLAELQRERECSICGIKRIGRAWVLPHPDRLSPSVAPMVSDPEIEKIAVRAAIAHEEARGWVVESVEAENRGFDLISRKPHPEDPQTTMAVRFVEVKGRAGVGEVALSRNEYRTAERLRGDYWLYVAYNCASTPDLYTIQDPVQLGFKPVVTIEHYSVGANAITHGAGAGDS